MIKGVSLRQPDDWVDRSMIAFNASKMPDSGIAPNIVVTQDFFKDTDEGEDKKRIKAYASRVLEEMKGQLPDPVIHSQKLTRVGGKAAAEVLVSWQNGANRLTQWLVFINRDENQVLVSTSTAAESDFADNEDMFRDLVNSIEM